MEQTRNNRQRSCKSQISDLAPHRDHTGHNHRCGYDNFGEWQGKGRYRQHRASHGAADKGCRHCQLAAMKCGDQANADNKCQMVKPDDRMANARQQPM